MYDVESVFQLLGVDKPPPTASKKTKKYIYARVSSKKQEADLKRQIQILVDAYPGHEVISDTGSGLNFKRSGLRTLLDRVYKGVVGEVVVLHKDRLSRFAGDLLEHLFVQAGVKLVVHGHDPVSGPVNDLADDLLAVTTFFVASHNGQRSAHNKRLGAQQDNKDRAGGKRRKVHPPAEDPEDTHLPEPGPATHA